MVPIAKVRHPINAPILRNDNKNGEKGHFVATHFVRVTYLPESGY